MARPSTTEARPARIAVVDTSNFRGFPLGGATSVIESVLQHSRDYPFDIDLFGITTDPSEEIGRRYRRAVAGNEFGFIPLARIHGSERPRPPVPVRIQTGWGYVTCRRPIVEPGAYQLLYLHHPEAFLLTVGHRLPVIYHLHNRFAVDLGFARYGIARTPFVKAAGMKLEELVVSRADRLVSVDQEIYEEILEKYPWAASKLTRIRPSLNATLFRPGSREEARDRLHIRRDSSVIAFAGRLSAKKGLPLILDAVADLARRRGGLTLLVAGDGEERERLQTWSSEHPVDVRLLGSVPRIALTDVYNAADVLAFASYHESAGLVLVESMACGTPVVATPAGLAPEVVRAGKTGLLVESRDSQVYAKALETVIAHSQELRSSCAAAAAEFTTSGRQVLDLIAEVLAQRNQGNVG